jgi:hypothetical protein
MNKDDNYIAALYESVCLNDPFNKGLDESTIDWDRFFYHAAEYNTFSTLIESFELKSASNHSGGRTETYHIETTNHKKFLLTLDFLNKKKVDYFAFVGIQGANKKDSLPSAEHFSNLKDSLEDDELFCFIRFEDEQGSYELTNKVGMSAFEVFSSLKTAVLHSIETTSAWSEKKIKGIVFMISQQEKSQRLPLYTKLLKKYFSEFSEIFLDEVSDKRYVNLIATKI